MKLLRNFEDLSDAEHLSERLRNKGVMTFISSKQSHGLHRYRTGALKVGVWAVLPHQFQDAAELLNNNKHKVSSPLSLQEILELESQAANSFTNSFNKLIVNTFAGMLLAMIVLLILNKSQR